MGVVRASVITGLDYWTLAMMHYDITTDISNCKYILPDHKLLTNSKELSQSPPEIRELPGR